LFGSEALAEDDSASFWMEDFKPASNAE